MPLSGCEDDIIIACVVMNYSLSCATPSYLCSLKLVLHVCDFGCERGKGREGKGEVEGGGGGDGGGEGQESEQAANCVNKRWLF